MSTATDKIKDQLRTVISTLSLRARIIILVSVLATAGLLGTLILADHTEYAVLFSGVAVNDAAKITEQLRKEHVPFRLEAGGTTILVSAEKVHEVRLSLAGQGLPQGGGIGFELFDTQKFGLSDFAQQVNYRRALQGELERTISQLDAVESTRVHLALPDRRVFARESKAPSAAITLKLHAGRSLPQAAVKSIVHLVSSSETGLAPDQITVVDTSGALLWGGQQGGIAGSGGPLDYRTRLEETLERRVHEILDAAFGAGHSVVKVTAEVALAQLEQTETEYDPDKVAVRSESSLEEKDARGGINVGGVPGVQGNLPGGPSPTSSPAEGASQRKTMTRNYEVNRTIRKKIMPAGQLERLSVAVLLDTKALHGTAAPTETPPASKSAKKAKKAGTGSASAATTTPATISLAALEQVVKQAVGFSASRGDVVTIQTVTFAPEPTLEPEQAPSYLVHLLKMKSEWLFIVIALVIGMAFLLWFTRRLLRQPYQQAELLELPKTVREIEAGTEPAPKALGQGEPQARVLAKAAAEHDSVRTATVLKAWLAEE